MSIDRLKFKVTESDTFGLYKSEKATNEAGFAELLIIPSKINIFIGANNSGKSRFLRNFFKYLKLNLIPRTESLIKTNFIEIETLNSNELIQNILNKIEEGMILTGASDGLEQENFKQELLKIFNQKTQNTSDIYFYDFKSILFEFENLPRIKSYLSPIKFGGNVTENIQAKRRLEREGLIVQIERVFNEMIENKKKGVNYAITYIPILRSFREIPAGSSANSQFYLKKRIISDYFPLNEGEYNEFIFTGENLYDEIETLLRSHKEDRDLLRYFENFIAETFFTKETEVSLIPRKYKDARYSSETVESKKNEEKNYDLYIKIGEAKEYPIFELGDGVLSIILILFPVYKNKNKTHYLFLEEPELHLHPGFQRVLMKAFQTTENLQVFMVTHSNHFLEMTLDPTYQVSIYNFRKNIYKTNNDAEFLIQNVNRPTMSVLDDLGVVNASVFLANCTIWVEGISDRLYIQKLLEIYMDNYNKKKFLEGLHFAFVEYGGSNIVHWDFENDNDIKERINSYSLSNRIFLVADGDNADVENNAKAIRLTKLKEILGANIFVTESKEIENLLPPSILSNIVKEYEKNDNLNIQLVWKKYFNTNLGEYIDNVLDNVTEHTKRRTYKKDNTISDKIEFCHKAIKQFGTIFDEIINDGNTAPEGKKTLKDLAESLYTFIEKSNPI